MWLYSITVCSSTVDPRLLPSGNPFQMSWKRFCICSLSWMTRLHSCSPAFFCASRSTDGGINGAINGDDGDDLAHSTTHPRCSQPFMMNSAVILKYLRAAEHFRRLLLERRASTAVVRWYRGDRDRKRFLKQKAAAVIVQVRRMTECWLPSILTLAATAPSPSVYNSKLGAAYVIF